AVAHQIGRAVVGALAGEGTHGGRIQLRGEAAAGHHGETQAEPETAIAPTEEPPSEISMADGVEGSAHQNRPRRLIMAPRVDRDGLQRSADAEGWAARRWRPTASSATPVAPRAPPVTM